MTRRRGTTILAFTVALVPVACAGDSVDVLDPLQAFDRAELVPRDEEDQLPEFTDGIATWGDARWFIEFPAGLRCDGDEVSLTIREGESPDQLVVEVVSSDTGDCGDVAESRKVVLVLSKEYADAEIVEVVADQSG